MYMDVGFFSISLAPMPDKQDIAIAKVALNPKPRNSTP